MYCKNRDLACKSPCHVPIGPLPRDAQLYSAVHLGTTLFEERDVEETVRGRTQARLRKHARARVRLDAGTNTCGRSVLPGEPCSWTHLSLADIIVLAGTADTAEWRSQSVL